MKLDINKTVTLGVMTSLALVMFVIELQLPPLTPIPGIKIGLSNIVALFLLFLGGRWKTRDVYTLQVIRILLGSMLTPNTSAVIYSFVAGIVAISVMVGIKKAFYSLPAPLVSAVGGIFHNSAQILLASQIMDSTAVFCYFPVLVISGILCGLLTGFAVYAIFRFYPRFINKLK